MPERKVGHEQAVQRVLDLVDELWPENDDLHPALRRGSYRSRFLAAIAGDEPEPIATRTMERFIKFVQVDEASGCWLWKASLNSNGYARIWTGPGKKMGLAHRVSYRLHKGEIPEGMTLDHLCRVRQCVNPDHLEATTQGENSLRGETIPGNNLRKTHCAQGHEYSEENTYTTPSGWRSCRTCNRKRIKERDRLRREARIQGAAQRECSEEAS